MFTFLKRQQQVLVLNFEHETENIDQNENIAMQYEDGEIVMSGEQRVRQRS